MNINFKDPTVGAALTLIELAKWQERLRLEEKEATKALLEIKKDKKRFRSLPKYIKISNERYLDERRSMQKHLEVLVYETLECISLFAKR